MPDERLCLRCGEKMEPGRLHVPFRSLTWISDAYWRLVLSLRFSRTYALVTYRCTKCGTLETVANEKT